MSFVIPRCHKVALVVPADGRYEIQAGFLLLQGDIYLLANFGLYIPDVCRLLQSHRNFVGLSPVKNVGVFMDKEYIHGTYDRVYMYL